VTQTVTAVVSRVEDVDVDPDVGLLLLGPAATNGGVEWRHLPTVVFHDRQEGRVALHTAARADRHERPVHSACIAGAAPRRHGRRRHRGAERRSACKNC